MNVDRKHTHRCHRNCGHKAELGTYILATQDKNAIYFFQTVILMYIVSIHIDVIRIADTYGSINYGHKRS